MHSRHADALVATLSLAPAAGHELSLTSLTFDGFRGLGAQGLGGVTYLLAVRTELT